MTESFVYLNGRIVPAREARVSVYDQGLLYGYGLFETMRAYQGRVFRAAEHLDRPGPAPHATLDLPLDGRLGELARAVNETLAANRLSDARVRLTVTAGDSASGPALPARGEPTVLVTASALPPAEARDREYERGWGGRRGLAGALQPLRYGRPQDRRAIVENLVARAEAVRAGADEALILNERGCLTEGAMTNVFVVKGGVLLTPATDCGLLPGITRSAVVALADPRMTVVQGWLPSPSRSRPTRSSSRTR